MCYIRGMREIGYTPPKREMHRFPVFTDELIKGVFEIDSFVNQGLIAEASFNSEIKVELSACLSGYAKNYLIDLALDYDLKIAASTKKQEIINKLAEQIISRFPKMMVYLPKSNLKFLTKFSVDNNVIKVNDNTLQYHEISHIHNFGLLFLYRRGKDLYAVVPKELIDSLKLLQEKRIWEMATLHQRFNAYAVALSNLYGVLDIDQFAFIWNRFEAEVITPAMAQDELKELEKVQYYWWFDDELIISSFFSNTDEVDEFLSKVRPVSYYIPTRGELISYFKAPYAQDSFAVSEMLEFLKGYKISADEQIEDLIEEITDSCVVGNGMQDVFNLLNEYEVLLNGMEEINKFTELYVQMSDSCRKWELRGHTPNSLKKSSRSG